jgi:hypothetical protein
MAKIASGKDLLMLLLHARGHRGEQCEPIRGRTRLMKMVFLFEKEVKQKLERGTVSDEGLPKFDADNFGPFSPQVFSDLEFLVDTGFVAPSDIADAELSEEEAAEYRYWQASDGEEGDAEPPEHEQEFCLTPLGKKFVETGFAGQFSQDEWAALDAFKARCTSAPLRSILRYVYTRYPETTKKSKIRDEILSRRPY